MNLDHITVDALIYSISNRIESPPTLKEYLIELSVSIYSITNDVDKSFKIALLIIKPHLKPHNNDFEFEAKEAYEYFKKLIEEQKQCKK